jgi:PAS domain S-box-containing protein
VARNNVFWVPDLRIDPLLLRRQVAAEAGLHSAVAFPLNDGRDAVGAILLFRREVAKPEERTTAMLNAIGHKIGEFARLDQALRRSGSHYRAIIENQADMVGLFGLDGVIHYENAAVAHVLGYDRRERLGRSVYDFIHPRDVPAALATFRASLEDPGAPHLFRVRVRHKDGSWRLLESAGRIMVDAAGRHVALITSRDITDRPKAGLEPGPTRDPDPPPAPGPALTERELATLQLAASGMSNKQIADAVGISPYTVKDQMNSIMRKLNARNRVQAAIIAARRGLI